MTNDDLVDRLTQHKTLGSAPRAQLEWLVAHGRYERLEPDQIAMRKGTPIDDLWIMLEGYAAFRVGQGPDTRKVYEWSGGDVGGMLPYSRMSTSPGVMTADQPLELLFVHKSHFPDLIRECHEVTAILVHVMLDRARRFTSNDVLDEKMKSLGRLSAGLAHELNNPASAVARSAESLMDHLDEMQVAFRALGALGLSADQLYVIDNVTNVCLRTFEPVRSAMQRADREDAFAEWLADHGADERTAESLAETAVTLEGLNTLAEALDGKALDVTLQALALSCSTRRLASEIESAATRIHGLVTAIKGFSYMDQADVPQPVDIARGLADTLAVIRSKARAKRVSVAVDVPPDLPRVQGWGGALNQVWANLLENALDAVSEEGHVQVSACADGPHVVVQFVDDGPGIPEDIRHRIFDPFFTTKPQGLGTGLGLDIVRRLVSRHDGFVELSTKPGRTEFSVHLPIAGASGAGGA